MLKINSEYKRVLLLLLSFLIIAFVLYSFFSAKPEPVEDVIITCEEYYTEFNKINKSLMLELLLAEQDETSSVYNDLYSTWLELKASLSLEQCGLFVKSKKLDKSIYKITESFRQAEETSLEKNPEKATLFFWQANNELGKLKEANDIFSADIIFLKMYKPIQAIRESADKEGATASLEELKFQFTELKQYSVGQEYLIIIKKMEKEIANLNKLLYGPDYIRAKDNLYKLFMEIYYKY